VGLHVSDANKPEAIAMSEVPLDDEDVTVAENDSFKVMIDRR
jgi:hypothetical protein